MLSEVGVMFTVYLGLRIYESYQKTKKIKPKNPSIEWLLKEDLKKTESKNKQDAQHYLSISTLSLGLAAVRQFFYPPLAPFSLGLYIYTNLPLMYHVEAWFFQKKKMNLEVLFFTLNTFALTTNRYFLAAFGVWLIHHSRHFLESVKNYLEKAFLNLFTPKPIKVWVLKDQVELETPLEQVKINDIVVVNPGETIMVDGIITAGEALIEQRILTQDPQPVEKKVGDEVFASTSIIRGQIYVRVQKVGQDTVIAQIWPNFETFFSYA